jgi:methylenetetrahydrofolate dehydrogenase (NADP+) / methenyltetrahydrofolate cyclohydrolase
MPARILDGKKLSQEITADLSNQVAELATRGIRPGLAAVLVGNDPGSEIYVRNKVKACEQLGLFGEKVTPDPQISTAELISVVQRLNAREDIDGILVQLPLPKQVDAKCVLMAVDPAKDVDGFHPMNVGLLSTMRPGLVPCTPAGCMEILRKSGIAVEGREAVVVGRSDIVGKPVAMLLTNANATVTICHSRTQNLAEVCRRADILVAALGKPALISREMVKPGATVIDVGINRITEASEFERIFGGDEARALQFEAKGSVLVGDVDPEVAEVAGAITPVPGGVGPLTVTMLMANTIKAAKLRRGLPV